MIFSVRDIIEAKYRGEETYYPGIITRDCGDNRYDITYDDGDVETGVQVDNIRQKFNPYVNEVVEARYMGEIQWYICFIV